MASTRAFIRVAPLAGLAAVAALAHGLAACGPKPAAIPVLTDRPAASAPAAEGRPSPLPSGLPPALPVPPMGVRGSTKATRRADGGAACTARQDPLGPRPEETVRRVAAACKLTASGPAFSGVVADDGPPKEARVQVKRGRCYRLIVAREAALVDAVALLRDSQGAALAEGPEVAVPAREKACFESDDELTLLVSAGTGRGAFAAQLVEVEP